MTKKQKLTFKTLVTLWAITLSVSFSSAQTDIAESHLLVHEAERLISYTEVPSRDDFHSAFDKLEEVIKKDPESAKAYIILARAKRLYAIIYLDKRNDESLRLQFRSEAKDLAKKATELAPETPKAYKIYYELMEDYESDLLRKGGGLTDKEKKEKENIERKLFSFDTDDPEILFIKGYDLIDRGKAKEGMELVLKSLPGEGDILFETFHLKEQLASYLRKKGQHKEADELEERIKMEKKINDGLSDLSTGDIDEGLRIIEESTKGDYSKIPKGTRKLIIELLERRALKLEEQIEKKMERETGKEKIVENPDQVKAHVHELKDKVKREEQQGKSDDKGKEE